MLFRSIDNIMVEHSLESLPLLVILLVPHAQHCTLLSIEDLESCLVSELLKGYANIIRGVYAYISNDQVLAIALLLKGCQLPSDYQLGDMPYPLIVSTMSDCT